MSAITIRVADPAEDEVLVRHYRALWQSYGVDDADILPDADDVVRDFIRGGHANAQLRIFLAEADGAIVGSLACQIETLPYPDVTQPGFRRHGYIWSVFVEPAARHRGAASALVEEAIVYLRSIGCTKAVLHASEAGEPVYRKAGFEPATEMRLTL